ncbi:hypothetical protein AX774_g1133 [Zancudomyces culisetae]|uniref:Uncharacterized protein n=1 Tax=Zancudomyces culisetae TaxID=1213189 RepID=A0A1R1PWL8_ZANCU|nr:hypothetical protein AX774_g1133 [Zancudomyces culisetae]|eukprot:OMH85327.1 hypothetical protein AX774_g1133 [Zancudomyces culisetae]
MVSKLAIVTRKKLVVYEWRDAEYRECKEYNCSERVESIGMGTVSMIIVATDKEFWSLELNHGQWDELFAADTASLLTVGASVVGRGREGMSAGMGGGMELGVGMGMGMGMGMGSNIEKDGGNINTDGNVIDATGAATTTTTPAAQGSYYGWGSWGLGLAGALSSSAGLGLFYGQKGNKPRIERMMNEELLLCRENIGVFITGFGKLSKRNYIKTDKNQAYGLGNITQHMGNIGPSIKFEQNPVGLTYSGSYVLGISGTETEIDFETMVERGGTKERGCGRVQRRRESKSYSRDQDQGQSGTQGKEQGQVQEQKQEVDTKSSNKTSATNKKGYVIEVRNVMTNNLVQQIALETTRFDIDSGGENVKSSDNLKWSGSVRKEIPEVNSKGRKSREQNEEDGEENENKNKNKNENENESDTGNDNENEGDDYDNYSDNEYENRELASDVPILIVKETGGSGGGRQVMVAGSRTVWRLVPVPIGEQVEEAIKEREYQEAESLVMRGADSMVIGKLQEEEEDEEEEEEEEENDGDGGGDRVAEKIGDSRKQSNDGGRGKIDSRQAILKKIRYLEAVDVLTTETNVVKVQEIRREIKQQEERQDKGSTTSTLTPTGTPILTPTEKKYQYHYRTRPDAEVENRRQSMMNRLMEMKIEPKKVIEIYETIFENKNNEDEKGNDGTEGVKFKRSGSGKR